jgi:uncharacterized protein (TIGR02145 family)
MKKLILIFIITFVFTGCKKSEDKTVEVIPLAPTELKATLISKDQVDLTWKDNSTNETGYKIERKTGLGNFIEIGTTLKDINTFSDKSISSNTGYIYRVFGYNKGGKSAQYSNEVNLGAPSLTTTAVSEISGISAISGGNIILIGGAPVTSRGVVWSTKSNPEITLNSKTGDGIGSGPYQSSITKLDHATKYYVRAYASNNSGTGYGNEITFTTAPFTFNLITSNTGRVWMDRNLGAGQVAKASGYINGEVHYADDSSFGYLYQWGRGSDGHQLRTSGTTSILSNTDLPGHNNFIIGSNYLDWRSPTNNNLWQGTNGTNNPCPKGFRIPTAAEWAEEITTWTSKNSNGAFSSKLKLPVAGIRTYSNVATTYTAGLASYWSSTTDGSRAKALYFRSDVAGISSDPRFYGHCVRCIME